MKKLPKQFSVYAKTKEEAVYICEKQKEMCGNTFSSPSECTFYRFSPNSDYDRWGFNDTSYINDPDLLKYEIQHEFTFEEFKSYFEEEFILPEMWCINFKRVSKEDKQWFITQIDNSYNYNNYHNEGCSYYHFNKLRSTDSGHTECHKNHTEITFEQFKKYILKEVNKNICFMSDETEETVKKIIEELEKLGGENRYKKNGEGIKYPFYYVDKNGCIDNSNAIPEGYELVNLNKEKIMKNRILTPENATRIINIACSTWKPKLAEKWATNIVLNKNTEISEEFYQEMRKACTTDQNDLFDEIFGKDEQLISPNNLAIGEAMKICDGGSYDGIIISRIWSEDKPRYVNINNTNYTWSGYPDFKGKKVKLTITHEEIK